MRSFLLVLVTALGVLGPGCTCAGRDPGAATTSEAVAPGEPSEPGAPAGDASATPAEATSGSTAKLERRRPVLRGPINPSMRLRQRPSLGARGMLNEPRLQTTPTPAPAASDAPAP